MHDHHHPSPFRRFLKLASEDQRDLWVILGYTLVQAVLALAVPLAAQALVNTVAAGLFLQPLLVLTGAVLAGLLFAGLLNCLQFWLSEVIRERIFARVSLRLARQIPMVQLGAFRKQNAPELMNRFFDVVNVQKSWSKIVFDGPSAFLSMMVSLALLAVYGPMLLVFALCLVAAGFFNLVVLGWGGVRTCIQESAWKYRIAGWLEELARCQTSLKVDGEPAFWLERTDDLLQAWIGNRRGHFAVLMRQHVSHHFMVAVAAAGVLGLGGYMVINHELTLGQLVAAELVVMGVLKSADKLIQLASPFYDLLTGLDKLGHLTDLPVDREGGSPMPVTPGPARVVCRGVKWSYRQGQDLLQGLDILLEPGQHGCLVGSNGEGKSTFANLVCGLVDPEVGSVEIDGVDLRGVDLDDLRDHVGLVHDHPEIFDGTLEDNILVGREVPQKNLNQALEISGLSADLPWMPQGLKTVLVSGGRNLSRSQWQRVQIARAIVDRPRLLVLDEACSGMDEKVMESLLDRLHDRKCPWTLLHLSNDAEIVRRADVVFVLRDGRIVESGAPMALATAADSQLSQHWPRLAREVARGLMPMEG